VHSTGSNNAYLGIIYCCDEELSYDFNKIKSNHGPTRKPATSIVDRQAEKERYPKQLDRGAMEGDRMEEEIQHPTSYNRRGTNLVPS
jgi:hypothetical protein